MKKIYIILSLIIITLVTSLSIFLKKENTNYIEYNGFKLALSVDGEEAYDLPSSNKYFLVDYTCENGTILTWDYNTSTLTSSNRNITDTCSLSFESSPTIYDLANIGDYISYTGDSANGCIEPQCSGWNDQQTSTGKNDLYGYCYYSGYKFHTYGWRILYKNDNSVYIVSAGAPECIESTSSDSASTITSLNTAALKYCNSDYLSGGTCDATTAHAFNGDDFYNFTSQYNGTDNARYLYNYDDGGTFGSPYCYDRSNKIKYCGYTKDIIDNGSYYWFGSAYSSESTLFWDKDRYVSYNSSVYDFGVRPVLKLDSTILATGGTGTMDDPYTISERTTS